jgi:hypothetical protein
LLILPPQDRGFDLLRSEMSASLPSFPQLSNPKEAITAFHDCPDGALIRLHQPRFRVIVALPRLISISASGLLRPPEVRAEQTRL